MSESGSPRLLKERNTNLVTVRREGRSMIYVAQFDAMNALVGFLTENCCGNGESCAAPVCLPEAPRKDSAA